MPYLALDIDRMMPLLDPLCVLEDRNISVIQAREVFRTAEENPGTLVQTVSVNRSRVEAAYMDFRPSNVYPRLKVRMDVVMRRHQRRRSQAFGFSVDCHAYTVETGIGYHFYSRDFDLSLQVLLSFVEFAGGWLDPRWFERNRVDGRVGANYIN